jgi:hypothetical protein
MGAIQTDVKRRPKVCDDSVQVSTERPTRASCGSPRHGSVSLHSSPCYWLVLLMRRLALVAEGSSRGGSSLQTEVLLSRAAITASCQLQVVPNLISLSFLLVVLCSSSRNRSCVCFARLKLQIPHYQHRRHCTFLSIPRQKAWETNSFCVLSGCSTLQCVATFLSICFCRTSASLEADLAIKRVDPW